MSTKVYNVLLVGETGVGKSSIVNMLAGEKVAPVNNKCSGCTFESSVYNINYKTKNKNYTLHLYDTVGLSEPESGQTPNKQAVNKLINLLVSLRDGIHVVLFCMKQGRVTGGIQNNYKIFVSSICRNKVPVILIATYCEHNVPNDPWWNDEKDKLRDNYGIDAVNGVCISNSVTHTSFRDYYKNNIMQSIIDFSLEKPWKKDRVSSWLMECLSDIVTYLGLKKIEKKDIIKLESEIESSFMAYRKEYYDDIDKLKKLVEDNIYSENNTDDTPRVLTNGKKKGITAQLKHLFKCFKK